MPRDYRKIYTPKGLGLLRQYGIDPRNVDGGNIKIKPVNCGKSQCRACPHHFYAYHRSRWGEKYLGVCNADGTPREKQKPAERPVKQTIMPGMSKKSLGRKKTSHIEPL